MKKINVPIIPSNLGQIFKSTDIWFVLQTNKFQKVVRPKRYQDIERGRVLRVLEKDLRNEMTYHESETSFIRAHLFNATNKMTPKRILQSNCHTYYFKLTPQEIERCLFITTTNFKSKVVKGVEGFISAYKDWSERELVEDEVISDRRSDEIEVVIPFKVKPQYYIPNIEKRVFYHGSIKRFNQLDKHSYVTPYKEDAVKFAVPWSSEELLVKDDEMSMLGRPPRRLIFKRGVDIKDSKVYLYAVKGVETISAGSSSGKDYPWNRITLKEATEDLKSLKLEKKIMSWKKELCSY